MSQPSSQPITQDPSASGEAPPAPAPDLAPAEAEPGSVPAPGAPAATPDVADAAPSDEGGGAARLVPVTEAIRYRKRAQAAEQQLGAVRATVAATQAELEMARHAAADLERRGQIDHLLLAAETIDLDAARLLTEQALGQMAEPDVAEAVEDLRRHKPYLFRRGAGGRGTLAASAMPARLADGPRRQATRAAERALDSGARRDLLRYLRLRRQT